MYPLSLTGSWSRHPLSNALTSASRVGTLGVSWRWSLDIESSGRVFVIYTGEVWEFVPDIWVRRGLGSLENGIGVGYEERD